MIYFQLFRRQLGNNTIDYGDIAFIRLAKGAFGYPVENILSVKNKKIVLTEEAIALKNMLKSFDDVQLDLIIGFTRFKEGGELFDLISKLIVHNDDAAKELSPLVHAVTEGKIRSLEDLSYHQNLAKNRVAGRSVDEPNIFDPELANRFSEDISDFISYHSGLTDDVYKERIAPPALEPAPDTLNPLGSEKSLPASDDPDLNRILTDLNTYLKRGVKKKTTKKDTKKAKPKKKAKPNKKGEK